MDNKIKTEKPLLPNASLKTRMEQFIGSTEGQPQRKQVIDSATQQRYVKFSLELFESERNDLKTLAKRLDMGANEFIVAAIREKMEKHSKDS